MSKINLDTELVKKARQISEKIADDVQGFVDGNTTVATERTIIRLLGVDGVDAMEVPYPNVVIDHLLENGKLEQGVCLYLGNAMIQEGLSAQEVAEKVATGDLNICELPMANYNEISEVINKMAVDAVATIAANREQRTAFLNEYGDKTGPLLYLIVATGNIYEDIIQAKAAARQGADVIAVIRTTGQSLLDYVPYGPTTEGFGGTYATQENFRIMRAALDEVGAEEKRYIRLCNYCSGLCMPEIAAMGAFERLDVMLNDALYGILFRDINMKRTIVDQYFSRIINGFAG
ncbi:MAG: lysine 5,6-aminomutase subunit alpha, partial [Erysipelotrichales bacterium]